MATDDELLVCRQFGDGCADHLVRLVGNCFVRGVASGLIGYERAHRQIAFADELVERSESGRRVYRLAHIGGRQTSLVNEFGDGGLMAVAGRQIGCRGADDGSSLDQALRKSEQMAFFCKRMSQLFPRAPVGEGGKGGAACAVEAFDGVEQAEGAFLDKVLIWQAEVAIAGSQATDEHEMALNE